MIEKNMKNSNTKEIYLNGHFLKELDAKIPPADRGFLLGDGLFETLRAYKGKILYLNHHWQRLQKSADFLEIKIPICYTELENIMTRLLLDNNLSQKEASLRLTLTRGCGPRGLLPSESSNPTLLIASFPYTAPITKQINIWISTIRRNEYSPLSNIKSLNYLDNILARKEAFNQGAEEAILLNSKANIASASAANIFMVNQANHILTPALSDGALPGVTRHNVINLAKKLNMPLFETSITVEDLKNSREIFLTSSLIGIQAVNRINGRNLFNIQNKIIEKIQKEYNEINQI